MISHIKLDLPLIDTRLEHFHEASTIPGARSIPHHEIRARLDDLELGHPTVFFCNGPQCGATPDAIRSLLECGFPEASILYYRGGCTTGSRSVCRSRHPAAGLVDSGRPTRQRSPVKVGTSSMEMLLAIPFGLAIGAVVGTVGGGGAILALPVLVYVLDQGVSSASTASLIVVAVAASVVPAGRPAMVTSAGGWR